MLSCAGTRAVLMALVIGTAALLGAASPAYADLRKPGDTPTPAPTPQLQTHRGGNSLKLTGDAAGTSGRNHAPSTGRTPAEQAELDCLYSGKKLRVLLMVECMRLRKDLESLPSQPRSPGAAAQHVVASMELRFPEIGIVPEPGPTSVGLVGVQNWMWVNNPEIFSTVSDSAAIGAWVIAVSGRVAWVDWDMGDGQVIRCTGPGTPYEDRYGLRRSPDCGHVYSVQGDYTVTATAHWVLHWSGGNESGTLTADQTASVPITIGEAFAVRRK